jgi:hypothetical protein
MRRGAHCCSISRRGVSVRCLARGDYGGIVEVELRYAELSPFTILPVDL